MINWKFQNLQIESSAKEQFDQYFNDIKLVLDRQNLSLKEHDIFADLEDHILDYVRNNNITKVTLEEAKDILSELGSPEEYADFSNLPDLIKKINPSKGKNSEKINASLDNQFKEPILCPNCNTKNYSDSIFCIQCGTSLENSSKANSKTFSNPLSFLFRKNPEYCFSLLSFFLLEILTFKILFFDSNLLSVKKLSGMIFQTYVDFFNLLLLLIFLNELIVVPGIFIKRLGNKDYSRSDLASFLTTYLLKILTLLSILLILDMLGNYPDKWTTILLFSCVFITYPILLTKLLFFSDRLKYFLLKIPLNRFSKLGYKISTVLLVLYTMLVYMYNNQIFILATMIIFVLFILFVLTDFGYLSKVFNEKVTKTSKSNSFVQIAEISSLDTPKKKIIWLIEKIQLIIVVILGALFISNIKFGVKEQQLSAFFLLDNIYLLVLVFIFVIIDIIFDVYYHKSYNIFLLALGIYFLDSLIYITYQFYWTNLIVFGSTNLKLSTELIKHYGLYPEILNIFVFLTVLIVLLLSVLVMKSGKLTRINNVSFSHNKIGNVILFCCYFMLSFVVNWVNQVDGYQFYYANLTFFLGFSLLLLIKPFLNLTNYFFLQKHHL